MPREVCHKHLADDPPSLFQNGNAVFQAHHVGWIVCGLFTAVATVASFWLIHKHLQWYTNKKEQRYIVRLLFLVPIYSIISFASFLFWNHSTPLILVRDAYEAIVLTSFFYLLLVYLSPNPEEQKRIFLKAGLSKANDTAARQRGEKLQRWVFPLGWVKTKPKDGLYFLQLMKWAVLQYCVIRPVTTLAAVILDYTGLYCESSWSPVWGHIWIVVIVSISVTVAMYCLIQLYVPVAKELAPHRPMLKLFSVKAVVFLTFWQATLLSLLSMAGVVKDTKYMTAEDINIGIGAILETFEMMIFAFVHIKAFTYTPYRPFHDVHSKDPPPARTPRLRSLGHALDFRETLREIWIGSIYLFDKMRGREPTPDFSIRRAAHYEEAFGRPRPAPPAQKYPNGQALNGAPARRDAPENAAKMKRSRPPDAMDISINRHVEVDVGGERQWLGTGDDYGYGLGYFRRERSEGLGVQIEKELQKRGYSAEDPDQAAQAVKDSVAPERVEEIDAEPLAKRRRSWWRTIYDRVSSTGRDEEVHDSGLTPSLPRRLQARSRSRRHSEVQRTLLQEPEHDLEDLPPSSALRSDHPLPTFHYSPPSGGGSGSGSSSSHHDADTLAPLSVYRERRRSYRPKHQRGESASALLPPPVPPLPYPVQRPEPRDAGEGGKDSHGLLAVSSSTYENARSDSLLHRIFAPSEAGSLNDPMREVDSTYSLRSVSTDGLSLGSMPMRGHPTALATVPQRPPSDEFGVTGDRRLHVQENLVHPSRSTNAMHTPWLVDIIHSESDLLAPPPLPAKDYVPPFARRSHRRESAHYRPSDMDSMSLPSLPEDPHLLSQPSLPYLPTTQEMTPSLTESLSSTYFSSILSDGSSIPEPRTPPPSHKRTTLRNSLDISSSGMSSGASSRPNPSTRPSSAATPSTPKRHSQSNVSRPPNSPSSSAYDRRLSHGAPSPRRVQLHDSRPMNISHEPLPTPRNLNPVRSRQSVDSADFSDISANTFYTAVSQPTSSSRRQ